MVDQSFGISEFQNLNKTEIQKFRDSEIPRIGVLALQGCVDPHRAHIEAAGGFFRPVKTAKDIQGVDALILPGGESTTMLKLIKIFDLWDVLKTHFETKPTWGICAGAILLAKTVQNPQQDSFAALDITVLRNGYGRQLDSTIEEIDGYPVSYIRAPVIEDVGSDITVHHRRDGQPDWVQSGPVMATTFHPEMNRDTPSPMHCQFVEMVQSHAKPNIIASNAS